MTLTPPEGSGISVLTDDSDVPTIIMPVTASAMRYFYAVFLLPVVVMWLGGLIVVVIRLLPVFWGEWAVMPFIVLWIVFWTVGGMFPARSLYCILRPPVPASLRLLPDGVDFDSGVQPPRLPQWGLGFSVEWKLGRGMSAYFPKRIQRRIDLGELKSLGLREVETGSRLSVDMDNERIEIARGATDVEREWLFQLLVDRYQLKTKV